MIIGVLTIVFSLLTVPSFAKENIKDLKKQIEALQKRVEELENAEKQKKEKSEPWGFFERKRKNQMIQERRMNTPDPPAKVIPFMLFLNHFQINHGYTLFLEYP